MLFSRLRKSFAARSNATKPASHRSRRVLRKPLLLEALEERTVPTVTITDAAAFVISSNAADNVAVGANTITGKVTVNGVDQTTNASAVTSLSVTATGNFANNIDLSGVVPSAFTQAGLTVNVDGGGGTNTLTGPDVAKTWNITDDNTGNIAAIFSSFTFANSQNLVAGSGADVFNFSVDGKKLDGTINGGATGSNLKYTGYTTPVSVVLTSSAATGFTGTDGGVTGGFSNINMFVGGTSNTDSIQGEDVVSKWSVGASDSYNVGIETASLVGFEKLIGGSAADTFALTGTSTVSLDGGGGSNTLDYSAFPSNVTVDFVAGTATGTNGIANIENFFGSTHTDTVTANAIDLTRNLDFTNNAPNPGGTLNFDAQDTTPTVNLPTISTPPPPPGLADVTTNGQKTFNLLNANISVTVDTTLSFNINTGNSPRTITVGLGATLRLTGAISGSGSITKLGAGTLVFASSANTLTGQTIVNAGTVLIDDVQVGSSVTVNSGGTLGGTGFAGPITVNSGGTLSPGNSPGIINTPSVLLNLGAIFAVEINGTTPGSLYDLVNSAGTVTLNDPTLSVVVGGGFVSKVGDTFEIINNGSALPVQGTGKFTGLVQGATFTPAGVFAGQLFQVSYIGGDGNDVVLTHINTPPTPAITGAPASSPEGTAIPLASTVLDPDPLDTFTFHWTVTKNGNPFGPIGTSSAFSFTPDQFGAYVVSLQVTDNNGGTNTVMQPIAVTDVAPSVAINGAPANSPEGTAITLTSTVTDPGTADTFSFAWSVTKNGNPFATGNLASFTFTPDLHGAYIVSLTVTDDGGLSSPPATAPITVTNLAPTAKINGSPVNSAEGTAIALTSTVTDPGTADTFTFAWNVTKNGNPFASAITPNFSFTPNDNGAYVVTLVATDSGGLTGSDSKSITVTNVAPTLSGVGLSLTTINENGSTTLSGNISDPGVLDTFTLSINWGDGSAIQTMNLAAGTPNFSVPHQFLDVTPNGAGSAIYSISAVLTDKDGGAASASRLVTVNNVAPTLSGVNVNSPILVNSTATLNGTITDPGQKDSFALTVNWGDGTASQTFKIQASGAPSGQTAFSVTHQYLDESDPNPSFAIQLNLVDKNGGAASASTSIVVSDVHELLPATIAVPNPDASVDPNARTFTIINGNFAFFAPGGAHDTASNYAATIAFSDGFTMPGIVVQVGALFQVRGSRTIPSPGGLLTAVVTVTDDGKTSAFVTSTILLGNATQIFVTQAVQSTTGTVLSKAALDTITTNITTGVTSQTALVQGLVSGRAALINTVRSLYIKIFKRDPATVDAGGNVVFTADPGANTWVQFLAQVGNETQLRAILLGSQEFFQENGGTASSFIDGLYQNILGRAPDPAGKANWLQALAVSSRTNVALAILQSAEGFAHALDDLFVTFLGRHILANGVLVDPAAQLGINFLETGGNINAVKAAIILSPEFFSHLLQGGNAAQIANPQLN